MNFKFFILFAAIFGFVSAQGVGSVISSLSSRIVPSQTSAESSSMTSMSSSVASSSASASSSSSGNLLSSASSAIASATGSSTTSAGTSLMTDNALPQIAVLVSLFAASFVALLA